MDYLVLFSRTALVRNPIHVASFFPKIHSRTPGRDHTHSVMGPGRGESVHQNTQSSPASSENIYEISISRNSCLLTHKTAICAETLI